ncbi:hypothetical protein [Caballeronia glathei]|nr:hypothetical protein [Caballeronia glathei]
MDMLIAQLRVAGEEDDRLATNTDRPTIDHEALEEYACDRSNLPWVIFRAAHRATHIAALPARARALLAALARTVDADRPYAAIFARRELLTGRALQSMRTFYRSLDDLEVAGLISRPPQKRYVSGGLFGRAYLHLTEKAAALLGFVEEPASPTSQQRSAERPAHAEQATSLISPNATVADGPIYKDLSPNTQKRQPARLPQDLQRLLNLGFREFLIFKLMREAKQNAKLLSDVVEATWEHLSRAKRPINYLRALLRSSVDFTHQVRVRDTARIETNLAHARAANAQRIIRAHAGQAFFDAQNARRFEVSEDGSTLNVCHHQESRPRIRAGDWAAEFSEALEAGLIVPATSEREAAFASKRTVHLNVPKPACDTQQSRQPLPVRTPEIASRLTDLKRLLRSVCAGGGGVPIKTQ